MGEGLRELIGRVDDDYLVGLSNKGILKRAYKDLEQEAPAADILVQLLCYLLRHSFHDPLRLLQHIPG